MASSARARQDRGVDQMRREVAVHPFGDPAAAARAWRIAHNPQRPSRPRRAQLDRLCNVGMGKAAHEREPRANTSMARLISGAEHTTPEASPGMVQQPPTTANNHTIAGRACDPLWQTDIRAQVCQVVVVGCTNCTSAVPRFGVAPVPTCTCQPIVAVLAEHYATRAHQDVLCAISCYIVGTPSPGNSS